LHFPTKRILLRYFTTVLNEKGKPQVSAAACSLPIQRVQHVDHFHGSTASRNVRESNDIAEEDRGAVILLRLDLTVLDLGRLLPQFEL